MSLISSADSFDIIKRKLCSYGKDAVGNTNPSTHTRIPGLSNGVKISGGKYNILPEHDELFIDKYIEYVLVKGNEEYITELQLNNGSEPILIDLDFRYPLDTPDDKRLYTSDHISNILYLYLDALPKIFNFKEAQTYPIFVFERDAPYKKYKKDNKNEVTEVKDGIHIVIGLQLAHKYQMLLRAKVIEACGKDEILNDMNLVKDLNDVFDDTISGGTSGWQLYGSKKPGCLPYKLTQYMQLTFDKSDGEFSIDRRSVEKFLSPKDISNNFHLLRGRYPDHLKPELQPNLDMVLNKICGTKVKGTTRPSGNKKSKLSVSAQFLADLSSNVLSNAVTEFLANLNGPDALFNIITTFLESLKLSETTVKDAHNLTQLLPEKYYQEGSHMENRQVSFALKNTDPRLFLSWVMLRSKADDFDYTEIPELYDKWTKYFNVNETKSNLTIGSLKYWVKTDAPEEYKLFQSTNLNVLLEDLIRSYTDGKVARILKLKHGDNYTCADIDHKCMYMFEKHHWTTDKGYDLRRLVSNDLLPLFQKKQDEAAAEWVRQSTEEGSDDLEVEFDTDLAESGKNAKKESDSMARIKKRMKKIAMVVEKLDNTATKNNSFRESMEVFYDPNFSKQLDTNRWAMCFNNGVLDLKTGDFRNGRADDYISMSTRIDYQPLSYYTEVHKDEYETTVTAIRTFFSQLFPIPSLERYMWDHLGSVLIGEKVEQVFNIYVGSGSNGKSLLTELMKFCMGDYKVFAPVNMLTEKRTAVGAATPETMNLKGGRYAVLQEPEKDIPINEGFVKEITGEADITGRHLFGSTETFALQVNFAACMNAMFSVKGTDDGIWRRLKVVAFLAKFIDKGENYEHDSDYIFEKDKTLIGKLPLWAPIFMSMLVEIAVKNQGVVKDCEEVTRYTTEFRQSQDVIRCFLSTRVELCPGGQVGTQNLHRAFKEWHHTTYNNAKSPKMSELDTAMNKMHGDKATQPNKKWNGVRVILETEKKNEENGAEVKEEIESANDL